jgi:hypothetical protein
MLIEDGLLKEMFVWTRSRKCDLGAFGRSSLNRDELTFSVNPTVPPPTFMPG